MVQQEVLTAHNFSVLSSLRLDLAEEVNRHFLENDYGDHFFSVVLN